MSATLASRANLDLLDSQYAAWKSDPASVDANWAAFFEGFEIGMERLAKQTPAATAGKGAGLSEIDLTFRMKVTDAVLRFRSLGHTGAFERMRAIGPGDLAAHPPVAGAGSARVTAGSRADRARRALDVRRADARG
jgi:hypothetical protein